MPSLLRARKAVLQTEGAAGLYQRALWALLASRGQELDEAVQLFRSALRGHRTADRLTDLAAAIFVRAKLNERPHELLLALDYLDEALELDPSLRAARHNRVLVLDSLRLATWTGEERDRYFEVETSDGWRAEVAALDVGVPSGYPPRGGRLELERRIGEWAVGARDAGRSELGGEFGRLLEAARDLYQELGDRLYLDSLGVLSGARQEERDRLVRAHAALFEARGGREYSSCDQSLDKARALFAGTGSPYISWTGIDLAICAFFRRDFQAAREELDRVANLVGDEPHLALKGRSLWIKGLVETQEGRFHQCRRDYERAKLAFGALGEVGRVSYLSSLEAECLDLAGETEKAWIARLRALGGLDAISSAERRFTVIEEAVEAMELQGRNEVALGYLEDQIAVVEQSPHGAPRDPLVFSRLDEGRIHWMEGRRLAAQRAWQKARAAWKELAQTNENRKRLGLDLAVTEAVLGRDASQSQLSPALEFLIKGSSDSGDLVEATRYRLLFSQARLAEANFAEATVVLSAAEQNLRNSIVAPESGSFELGKQYLEVVELLALAHRSRGDLQQAYFWVDRAASVRAGDSGPWKSADHLYRELAALDRVSVLHYVQAGTSIQRWLIETSGTISVETLSQTYGQVASLADELRQAAAGRERQLTDLGHVLLPREGWEGSDRVLIVATGPLKTVNFGELPAFGGDLPLSPTSGYSVISSLSIALRARLAYRDRPQAGGDMVVLAPTGTGRLFPSLPALTSSSNAVEALIASLPRGQVLTGRRASKESVLDAFSKATLAHLAVHTVPGGEGRSGTALLLSGDSHATALLDEQALGGLEKLPETLVLAGCSTGAPLAESSNSVGLALAFLGAGVPEVIASLGDVTERQSHWFFAEVFAGRGHDGSLFRAFGRAVARSRRGPSLLEAAASYQFYGIPRDWVL